MLSIRLLVFLSVLYQNACGYRILGVLTVPSKSHYYIGHHLLKGLAEEGHDVTVISPFKEDKPIRNYKEVFLEHSAIGFQKSLSQNNFVDWANMYFWDLHFKYYDVGDHMTKWAISSKNLQEFMKIKQHFDVVIIEVSVVDSMLGFGNYYNAPVVVVSPFGASKWTTDLIGTPNFPSYIPHNMNSYTDRMTFWQRMYNSLSFWFEDIVMPLYFIPKQQKYMEQLFPEAKNWPSLEEIRRNVSLVLLNTHVTIGTPRPYASNMIEVGGMQIQKKLSPLPSKMQQFLDEANDGAILLSLGSNVLITKLPKHQYFAIMNAFRPFSNIRILIKSDEDVIIPSHNQSDVLVDNWFDQQSILAHKNVRLFVTHGGLLSTTEAVYFGKPIVGIPFFFDQYMNMRLAEQKGFGVNIPIETLNGNNIALAVKNVLLNSSYTEQARLISDRFRDQPHNPLETGMHWVKHVAKNRGAPHLKSVAVDLPFYALYNLDVWAFIFCILIIKCFFFIKLIRLAFSTIIGLKYIGKLENLKKE